MGYASSEQGFGHLPIHILVLTWPLKLTNKQTVFPKTFQKTSRQYQGRVNNAKLLSLTYISVDTGHTFKIRPTDSKVKPQIYNKLYNL